ncbi:MAG: FAD binding domain-containing protein [Alphaproteobacteria bacterium]
MYDFRYHRPSSIDAAVALLDAAEDGQPLAGGQTLIPTLRQRLAQPSDLVDLAGIDDLAGIRILGGSVEVGAMTLHADVAASNDLRKAIPALAALASLIGDPQVRNRGTIGGSLATNDPAADYPAAVLGLDATIQTNRREIAADTFFAGLFETALKESEIITGVSFPLPEKAGYAKFPNPASRYAIAGVFVAHTGSVVRVAATGAGDCVFRVRAFERALAVDFSPGALDGVAVEAEALNSDIHASAEYRAHLIGVMAKRAVASAS